LFAAFAVIAGMTIAISPAPAWCCGHLGVTMIDLSARDIPRSPPACNCRRRARASQRKDRRS